MMLHSPNFGTKTADAASVLAHELRSPLSAIENSIRMIRAIGHSDLAVVEAVEIIGRQTAFMSRLVDDLLDLRGPNKAGSHWSKNTLICNEACPTRSKHVAPRLMSAANAWPYHCRKRRVPFWATRPGSAKS